MGRGHIVALGGGGFTTEPRNPLLDDFVLSLAPRPRPRICFLPTASGDSPAYIARFYRAFSGRAIPTDVTLFGSVALPRSPERSSDLATLFSEQDVFYVGGGNTLNMLALWRAHGVDALLREAWEAGAVLSGMSSGMICWFEGGLTDSFGTLSPLPDGLGLLEGSACPHYDDPGGKESRRAAYHRAVRNGLGPGYGADDGVALHFEGTELSEAVSSSRAPGAYRVHLDGGDVVEERISVRYLGG